MEPHLALLPGSLPHLMFQVLIVLALAVILLELRRSLRAALGRLRHRRPPVPAGAADPAASDVIRRAIAPAPTDVRAVVPLPSPAPPAAAISPAMARAALTAIAVFTVAAALIIRGARSGS